MNTEELRSLKRQYEDAGIRFVREVEPGSGPRVGGILARSKDDVWIAIGDANVDSDLRDILTKILDAISQGHIY